MKIVFEGNSKLRNSSITLLKAVKHDNSHSTSNQNSPLDYSDTTRSVEHEVAVF